MKTETQIAEENIKRYKIGETSLFLECCREHKATCQRFLEFLEEKMKRDVKVGLTDWIIDEKITDLKQAIKLYNEAGI